LPTITKIIKTNEKIINNSDKRLWFPKLDFAIDSNEIKLVTDEQYDELIKNSLITEVIITKQFNTTNIDSTIKKSKKHKNN